mgnify:CR=1 FL=1
MKIQIEYADGSTQDIVTGTDWKTTESPVTYSSIYGGEDYDATKEQTGWMQPGFDDRTWNKALDTGWKTRLLSQRSAPLTVRDRIPTVRLSDPERTMGVRFGTKLFRHHTAFPAFKGHASG